MIRTAIYKKQHQVTEQKFSLLISGHIMTFDYGLPAELFMAKRKGWGTFSAHKSSFCYRR